MPTDPGAGLLDMTFVASPSALGTFGLFAVGGVGNSEWSDNTPGSPMAREFTNITTGGAHTRIGQINVVPNPTAACAGVIGFGLIGSCKRWRKRVVR